MNPVLFKPQVAAQTGCLSRPSPPTSIPCTPKAGLAPWALAPPPERQVQTQVGEGTARPLLPFIRKQSGASKAAGTLTLALTTCKYTSLGSRDIQP